MPWGNRGSAEIYKVGSKMITFFAYSQCLGIMRRPVFSRVVYSKHQKKKKRCSIHYWGLECKSRKSRDTRVTDKYDLEVKNEAGQRLTEFCQENALVIKDPFSTAQETTLHMDITEW